jgi:predicted ArsR family transcriptional regulator
VKLVDAGGTGPGAGGNSADGRTRDAVARLVQQSGPQTAAALAGRLALSPAAIRRHLDALVAEGVLAEVAAKPSARRPRGRGRPARVYALTDAGRSRFGHAYDDLASTALRYLKQAGGEQAIVGFADHRAAALASSIRGRLDGQQLSVAEKATLVAEVLTDEGYVANAAPAGLGTQICQHHCPVAHVAAEFPELCEAETRALAEALGTNVQRLATIAHGDGVCTTHIPAESRRGPRTATPAAPEAGPMAPTSTTGGRQ